MTNQSPLSENLPPVIDAQLSIEIPRVGSQQTAKKAVAILEAKNVGFHAPSALERRALLVAFAMQNKVLYGAAFDVVRATEPVNFSDPADIAHKLPSITVYEVKSTNRTSVGTDLKGYFFTLSTAELLVAQSLGEHFRFAFVNTLTGEYEDLMLREIFARARGIYPSWSIKF